MNVDIRVRRKCEGCPDSSGVVQHPLWVEYWEWMDSRGSSRRSLDEEARWWEDHGHPQLPPPEEVACKLCEGSGYVEAWEPLDVLLAELSAALRRGSQ